MKLHCLFEAEARFKPTCADECEPSESELNLGLTSEATSFAELVFSYPGGHGPSPLLLACLAIEDAGFPRNPSVLF